MPVWVCFLVLAPPCPALHVSEFGAIPNVLNATDVKIHDNVFEGFARNVLVDEKTTRNIQTK